MLTKTDYDLLGTATKLWKLYTKNSGDIGNLSKYKKLSELAVDEFGRAKTKTIGEDPANPGSPIETQDFTYNMQGWLTGMNKDYALAAGNLSNQFSRRFGYYLGYENSDGNFAAKQYNGSITGVIWRSQGDNALRKYDYTYDNINRFKTANFTQKDNPAAAGWSAALIDLSASVSGYDASGNILGMMQKGIVPGTNGGVVIDDLQYQYSYLSNKLGAVSDLANTAYSGKQGDFKDYAGTSDYGYDRNGNITYDKNKNIINPASSQADFNPQAGILYNFLDLPHAITIKDKSKTEYTYDAAGSKLSKKVTQLTPGAPAPVTTWYIGGFVYEEVAANTNLQYILNEEGKLRITDVTPYTSPGGVLQMGITGNIDFGLGATKWGVWDYYLKDNLSNTRMVLTAEQHVQIMKCGMEDANATVKAEEEATFGNTTNNEVVSTRIARPPAWQSNSTLTVSKLVSTGSLAVGPNAILKVMAGDAISATANYFYQLNGTAQNTGITNTIVNSLLGALGGSGNIGAGIKDNLITTIPALANGNVNNFITGNQPAAGNTATPRAYLNFIFFDEQFRYVSESSIAKMVEDNGGSNQNREGQTAIPNIKASKNGYVYIYLSNETENIPVYFDDLSINHTRGPIVEDNAYYPFGLKIQGISAKAAGKPKAKQGYQGDYNEQDDETGYNEFTLRFYDPQIGRWLQVDPKDIEPGMYNGMGNNPINQIDPDGGETKDFIQNKVSGKIFWNDNVIDGETFKQFYDPKYFSYRGTNFWADTKDQNGSQIWYGSSADDISLFKTMQSVTVNSIVHTSLMGRAYPHFKEITKENVAIWNNSHALYKQRADNNLPIVQGGESEHYLNRLDFLKSNYQAQKDYRKMQVGVVGIIAAPFVLGEAGVFTIAEGIVSRYGARFLTNLGINAIQNRGNVDFSDVLINTLNPFEKFGFGGQISTQFINASIDLKINSGVRTIFSRDKSITDAGIDLIFGTVGVGFKNTADIFKGASVSRNYFYDVISGNVKTSVKENLSSRGF